MKVERTLDSCFRLTTITLLMSLNHILGGERHNVLSVSIFICTKMDGFFYTLSIMPVLEELLIGQAFIILRLLFPQKHESNLLVKWKNLVHEAALLPFFQVVPTDSSEKRTKNILLIPIFLTNICPFEKVMPHKRKSQDIINMSSCLFGFHFLTKSPKGKTKHFSIVLIIHFIKVRWYQITSNQELHAYNQNPNLKGNFQLSLLTTTFHFLFLK